jgi:outer membrane biosynthesis protein TonB
MMVPLCRMVNTVRLTPPDRLPAGDAARILLHGRAALSRSSGRLKMMYRLLTIVGGALALAACTSTPDWMNLDAFKPAPIMDTVRFESVPPGAEAKTSNGQTCRTPCALALPVNSPLTVTFTLNGYQPESETIEPIASTGSPTELRPNPVTVELTPAPPPPKPVKKPARKKKTAAKPATTPKPATAAAPPPMTAAPAQQPAPAPWPAAPPPQR